MFINSKEVYKMSKIKTFIEDRNEVFASGDIDKIKAYCRKYKIEIPEDEEVFLAGVHKSVCNLYLLDDSPVTLEQFNKSFDWLNEHGYSPSITFDLSDSDMIEDEEGEEGEENVQKT